MKSTFDIKKIVKNIGYTLIIGTLALAYFSPSVINYFIPKVDILEPVYNANVEKFVSITGMTKPRNQVPIEINKLIVVDRMMRRSGDHLKIGQTLAKVTVVSEDDSIGTIPETEDKMEIIKKEIRNLAIKKDNIQENNIKQVKEQIESCKQKNADNQTLYENGAIAKSSLESGEMTLENLLISKASLYEQIESLELNIEKMEEEIKGLDRTLISERMAVDENFYIEDGELKSLFAGIIVDLDKDAEIVSPNKSFGTFAKVKTHDDLYFEASIPLEESLEIQVNDELVFKNQYTDNEFIIKVESKSYLIDDNLIRIQGAFLGDRRFPILFEVLSGDVKPFLIGGQKMMRDYPTLVLKSCIRPTGGVLEEGGSASVYYVEEKEGVLGTETYAVELPVSIQAIGDFYVAIGGVDRDEEYKFINNLDHNIRDGQRIVVQEK